MLFTMRHVPSCHERREQPCSHSRQLHSMCPLQEDLEQRAPLLAAHGALLAHLQEGVGCWAQQDTRHPVSGWACLPAATCTALHAIITDMHACMGMCSSQPAHMCCLHFWQCRTWAFAAQPSHTRWPHGPVMQAPGCKHTGHSWAASWAGFTGRSSIASWPTAAAASCSTCCTPLPLLGPAPSAAWPAALPSSTRSTPAHFTASFRARARAIGSLPSPFGTCGSAPAAMSAAAAAVAAWLCLLNQMARWRGWSPAMSV